MISLSANSACLLYLACTLGLLLSLWIFGHLIKPKKKLEIAEKKLNVCEFCHFAFLSEKGKTIAKCPQCQCFLKNSSTD